MYDFSEISLNIICMQHNADKLSSWLSWKNRLCCESLEQIYLDIVQKWNKTYSFDVSIGLLTLCLIVTQKQALFWKFGADLCGWSWETEQSVQFWSQYTVVTPLFNCHENKNKPCSESFDQVHLDGVEKQNKMYSFEVHIGLLPLFLIVMKKWALL